MQCFQKHNNLFINDIDIEFYKCDIWRIDFVFLIISFDNIDCCLNFWYCWKIFVCCDIWFWISKFNIIDLLFFVFYEIYFDLILKD